MPPELITADFLEKTNGFMEPIMIPAALNPRTQLFIEEENEPRLPTPADQEATAPEAQFEYETVVDDGQDRLDMVIPHGLTVRRVAELYGPNETVPVIDVKAQEGEGKKWTMSKWADYYEQRGEKPVRNVISLEVSRSRLGKLIRRPKAVRDMDLQDAVWREDDKFAPPPVQFYCLMSVADCFTDFHIDFGGSSVYYHIVKGRKVFFMIPPTKQNLKKYEDWCLSPNQGHDWLGKQVKECYRVDLYPGDTMLIPSGWIHAVWTPEDSLVIGGNFLTRIHYGMQIKVLEIEKSTKVALLFRYPFFQKIMWLTVIKYLEEDPVPESVQRLLQGGEQFGRAVPIYCEPDKFGHNSHLGATNYNRRYYSKHELEGVTDLLNYIWRTVLISLDKIDLPQKTRNAVAKSIPKGHGDPLVLARRFAMWIAWKRGNENIPSWAFPDASLPENAEVSEKKLSAAQVRKMERETLRATAERSSARIRASDTLPPQPNPTFFMNPAPPPNNFTPSLGNASPIARDPMPSQGNPMLPVEYSLPLNGLPLPTNDQRSPSFHEPTPPMGAEDMLHYDMTSVTSGPMTGFLRPGAGNPHITTPKTSQLGPKRVACDACRKRRIRCKHKDELIDTSKPGMHTIDLSGSYGISVKRRLSDHSIADGLSSVTNGPSNGGPIMADVNGDPYALKSGRVKACADCRKSKVSMRRVINWLNNSHEQRRCIHDEYGNVDPVKANEVPIPRGSATKKRRVSDADSTTSLKRFKHESSYDDEYMNGDVHARHSLPNQFDVGSSLLQLQDIAVSAQHALARGEDDNLVPVDPALQAYANRAFSAMDTAPTYATNDDSIVSSIEQQVEGDVPMDGTNFPGQNGGAHGPSIEPLTPGPPGPPPHNDTIPAQGNGYPAQTDGFASRHATSHNSDPHPPPHNADPHPPPHNAVRHLSSPVSPRQISAMSLDPHNYNAYITSPTMTNHNAFTTNSDFPPPLTRTAHAQHQHMQSPSKTPNGRRRDSKDSIKLEATTGMDVAMMDFDLIDPSLDQASIELIKQLQKEEHGLRRRSRD
jgi:F-box/leucine-rich repeat protein 10/11